MDSSSASELGSLLCGLQLILYRLDVIQIFEFRCSMLFSNSGHDVPAQSAGL